MLQTTMRRVLSIFGSPMLAVLLAGNSAHGGVIQDSAILPPANGDYTLNANVCLLGGCIVEAAVGNLMPISSNIAGGNQFVIASGLLTADVFENLGGSPGEQIGTLSMPGTLSITYVGRTGQDQLGTFTSLLTAFDFSGTFNMHTLRVWLSVNQGSNSGITTITAIPTAGTYLVDSFFNASAELSLDGGPFIPGPERQLSLQAPIPEPEA